MKVKIKKIPRWPKYYVSRKGDVYSKKRNGFKKLKPTLVKRGKGYPRVAFSRDNKLHSFLVSRLVLTTFIGPCPEGYECDHKDGNPRNNNLDNLEWVTHQENMDRYYNNREIFPRGEECKCSKLTEKDVKKIRKLLKRGYITKKQIAEMFGVTKTNIYHIERRNSWAWLKD